jgi:hypothetical protein
MINSRLHRCSFGLAVTPATCCNTAADRHVVVNNQHIFPEDLQLPLGDETFKARYGTDKNLQYSR